MNIDFNLHLFLLVTSNNFAGEDINKIGATPTSYKVLQLIIWTAVLKSDITR